MNTFPKHLSKIPTGVSGLDTILYGGLIEKRVYLITGVAGSGKTILANQICFQHLSVGGKALYITLMEETHNQLFENLETLSFFNRKPIGSTLHYFSGANVFEKEGLPGLLEYLRGIVRDKRPTLLVIDTLLTTADGLQTDMDVRWFIKQLSVISEAYGCTVLLLSYPSVNDMLQPKTILSDGVIRLYVKTQGRRVIRELQVHKYRASEYLEGRHTYKITRGGLVVHPRLEAQFIPSAAFIAQPRSRLHLGVPQLDAMTGGGIFSGSTTMLLGVPGSGKTLLGLHFLTAGARQDEPGLYFGFYEAPIYLLPKADAIGLDFSGQVQRGMIEVIWQAPLENLLDALAEQLLEAVRTRKVRRLFIDGLAGFQQAADYPERLNRFFSALTNELRVLGVTTLFSVEMRQLFGPTVDMPFEGISIIADNIIFLRYVELRSKLYRLISILKLRESSYETNIREFRITEQGIQVTATFESAQDILTGTATHDASKSDHVED